MRAAFNVIVVEMVQPQHPMGLDGMELVMALEESFGVTIRTQRLWSAALPPQ